MGVHQSDTVRSTDTDVVFGGDMGKVRFQLCSFVIGFRKSGGDNECSRHTHLTGFPYDFNARLTRDADDH
jgi:hypothetical protein